MMMMVIVAMVSPPAPQSLSESFRWTIQTIWHAFALIKLHKNILLTMFGFLAIFIADIVSFFIKSLHLQCWETYPIVSIHQMWGISIVVAMALILDHTLTHH